MKGLIACTLLSLLVAMPAHSDVIYQFNGQNGFGETITASMVIADPPATANTGWSSLDPSALLSWTVESAEYGNFSFDGIIYKTPSGDFIEYPDFNSTGWTLYYGSLESTDGSELDGGNFDYALSPSDMFVPQLFQFSSTSGMDLVEFGGLGPLAGSLFYGDWTAASVPVSEPTTVLLFGSGLIGLAGLRRKFRK